MYLTKIQWIPVGMQKVRRFVMRKVIREILSSVSFEKSLRGYDSQTITEYIGKDKVALRRYCIGLVIWFAKFALIAVIIMSLFAVLTGGGVYFLGNRIF